jgi:hypothetical protein
VRTRTSATPRALTALLITAALGACSSPEKQLEQSDKKIEGLRATAQTIGQAWLKGEVSERYASAAFQQTLQLLDKERATLTASPRLLLDPRGASVSRDAEHLSRVLAALIDDAHHGDDASARRHLADVAGSRGSP